ncbi:hypothetical protein KIN20_000543 [Parelaphostrongylus tenuis]|uniref:Uncharacterized protein n=1 Tax=Parelaphostrongylus tenuis TaxID=148309 RepID=A0AAD5LVN0_PARTN|nr:hypothetical protein KIN20_000543 [Parelaphostrongylus tenuis]
MKEKPHCIIIGNTVTALCDAMPGGGGGKDICDVTMGMGSMIVPITNYTTISGTFTV